MCMHFYANTRNMYERFVIYIIKGITGILLKRNNIVINLMYCDEGKHAR